MPPLTKQESTELHQLLEQEEREMVSPKIEALRRPARYKIAYGGRGAGAKSWSFMSLLVQKANKKKTQIICLREVQKTLSESSHKVIENTIERLQYKNWIITDEKIKNKLNGSYFIFRGLKDLRATLNIKGLEDFDIASIDEASALSHDSWVFLTPTIRKKGSEIWATFNREEELDPVYELFCINPPQNSIIVNLEPGRIDNPWWDETELQADWDWWKKHDPDEWEHMYLGQPRKQGQHAVMSRVAVRGAMNREINGMGAIEIGVDVARFGDDRTTIWKRKGLKIIDRKSFTGQDTQRTAKEVWAMAENKSFISIKVDDTGVGGGVTDRLREFGAKVVPVNFADSPIDSNCFTSAADEMWFTFPIDEVDIPNDNQLMQELAGRRYDFDNKGRRKIEPKKEFKKRIGRSPDDADGLLLCFYGGGKVMMSDKTRKQLAERRRKR